MAEIGDYIVEYTYESGPKEYNHFTWDQLIKMYKDNNYNIILVESIKESPHRPIDITKKILEALKKLVDNQTPE